MILRAIHAALHRLDRPRVRAFEEALRHPEEAQAARLRGFLRANAGSVHGRGRGYAAIHSVRAFQERVPVMDAAALEPWVARIAAGEPGILTTAPVRILEPTSGSTGGNRLIPFTDPFLTEMRGALAPWMADLFRARPALRGLRQ
ncbi:MAG: autotransporter, partial [Gemmatimonadales bacterium]